MEIALGKMDHVGDTGAKQGLSSPKGSNIRNFK
jgi:hypothetical protein